MSFATMMELADRQTRIYQHPLAGPKLTVIAAVARNCAAGSEYSPVSLPALEPIAKTLYQCGDPQVVAEAMELLVAANPNQYVQTLRELTAPIRTGTGSGLGEDAPEGLMGVVLGFFSSAGWRFRFDFPLRPERFDDSVHRLTPELLSSPTLNRVGKVDDLAAGRFSEPIKLFGEGPQEGAAKAGHIMNLMESLRRLQARVEGGWGPSSLVSTILDQLTFRACTTLSVGARLQALAEVTARTTSPLVEAVQAARERSGQ